MLSVGGPISYGKQSPAPRVSFFNRVLTDQREKVLCDAVEWQHEFSSGKKVIMASAVSLLIVGVR